MKVDQHAIIKEEHVARRSPDLNRQFSSKSFLHTNGHTVCVGALWQKILTLNEPA